MHTGCISNSRPALGPLSVNETPRGDFNMHLEADWMVKRRKCVECGEVRSVKYTNEWDQPVCNKCYLAHILKKRNGGVDVNV